MRRSRWARTIAGVATVLLGLSACASAITGTATVENAPDSTMNVVGSDPSSSFDQSVKNAITDVEAFWKINFPKVSGGKPLPPLKGGLFSVDGLKVVRDKAVVGEAGKNGCIERSPTFIVDNGAFCLLDDSIAWDRAETHLFAQLAKQYGDLVVALVFAHEYGHAISYRLGVFENRPKTILTESQADCAAGAWAASAIAHQNPHFRTVTLSDLDDALEGFLDGRDKTPGENEELSHGNGFDRLSALADGLKNGVKYCYSKDYFNRTFTERPFASAADYNAGGNAPFADSVASDGFVVQDLNRFWTGAAKSIGKTFEPVKVVEASHPKCGSDPSSKFGYCPDDNTVYFDRSFAMKAYNSFPDLNVDSSNGNVTLVFDQPADFALGTLFAIGWGMAVRHQLFKRSLDDKDALLAAACYTGAYAKDVNIATNPGDKKLTLSPADLDEAVSAMLDLVGQDNAYSSRGSTGLDRIQSFVGGYKGGLSSC